MVFILAVKLLLRLLHTQLQHSVGFAHFGRRAAVKGTMRPDSMCPHVTTANECPIVA
jgi:hypothetical protein